MAFVKVKSMTGAVKTVPKSFFETVLKSQGYEMVTKNHMKKIELENDAEEVEQHEHEENDLESIPLSEMNSKQVREYAKLKGIDVTGAKSMREAREIIRREMNK